MSNFGSRRALTALALILVACGVATAVVLARRAAPTPSAPTPNPKPTQARTAAPTPSPVLHAAPGTASLVVSGPGIAQQSVAQATVTCVGVAHNNGLQANSIIVQGTLADGVVMIQINDFVGDHSFVVLATVNHHDPGWIEPSETAAGNGISSFDITHGASINANLPPDTSSPGQTAPAGPLHVEGLITCP